MMNNQDDRIKKLQQVLREAMRSGRLYRQVYVAAYPKIHASREAESVARGRVRSSKTRY